MTVAEAIARAREALRRGGVPADEAAGDAEYLARHLLGWDLARLVASRNEAVSTAFERAYAALLARRLSREPVSQIVGRREFWGLDFDVTRDVLTPRPETELVVEAALEAARTAPPSLIVDVGTGSGCLAVALATEFPSARLIATDVSLEALAVARRNALRHGVNERIAFFHADLLAPVPEIDLIVSNPPYVPLRDAASLPPEVRDYEPHIALFGGADGLDVYRRLLRDARMEIADTGRLILEVGYDQARDVAALARRAAWDLERSHRDLQGIERVLTFTAARR